MLGICGKMLYMFSGAAYIFWCNGKCQYSGVEYLEFWSHQKIDVANMRAETRLALVKQVIKSRLHLEAAMMT